MLSDDLAEVAVELITEFGADGKFEKNDAEYDPFMGTSTGTPTKINVKFFIEPFESKELIEGRILSGDAKLYTFDKPSEDWKFIDKNGTSWNFANGEIISYWLQGKEVAFLSHIRK